VEEAVGRLVPEPEKKRMRTSIGKVAKEKLLDGSGIGWGFGQEVPRRGPRHGKR
jgi:hypothetical protein